MSDLSVPAESELIGFRNGVSEVLPFMLTVLPFGIVVGALAAKADWPLSAALLQSALFFAGASQVVTLELFGEGQPVWVIALAVFAVNFRMVLYSAAIGRKLEPMPAPRVMGVLYLLQDISFVMGLKRAEKQRLTFGYAMGNSLVLYAVWLGGTAIGVVFGNFIENPDAVGLDMLVPIYFLLLALGFRSKPNSIWVFTSSALAATFAYIVFGSPYHIAAGGLCGMACAALLAKPKPEAEAAGRTGA
ncbi:MAG: AzlC family ABC transporter permease [Pseudomonadota bacterium]